MSLLGHSRPRWSRPTLVLVRFAPKATIQGMSLNWRQVPIAAVTVRYADAPLRKNGRRPGTAARYATHATGRAIAPVEFRTASPPPRKSWQLRLKRRNSRIYFTPCRPSSISMRRNRRTPARRRDESHKTKCTAWLSKDLATTLLLVARQWCKHVSNLQLRSDMYQRPRPACFRRKQSADHRVDRAYRRRVPVPTENFHCRREGVLPAAPYLNS